MGSDKKTRGQAKGSARTRPGQSPAETAKVGQDEWNVYFEGNFWGYHGKSRAGEEIPIGRQFIWGENTWHIPAVYACGAGLVVDFCVQAEPERIREFLDKWYSHYKNRAKPHDEESEIILGENPLNIDFEAQLVLNGNILRQKHGCALSWIPESCRRGEMQSDRDAEMILKHYGLDLSCGWSIHRAAFPWATKSKPAMQPLKITLTPAPDLIPGIHFLSPKVGESISFSHPVTGGEHTLTVREYEHQEMDAKVFCDDSQEFPTHYVTMTYTISPDLPRQEFSLLDCAQSDRPRRKSADGTTVIGGGASAIGLISKTGETAMVSLPDGTRANPHTVFSALRFEPAKQIEWRTVFRVMRKNRIDITLDTQS